MCIDRATELINYSSNRFPQMAEECFGNAIEFKTNLCPEDQTVIIEAKVPTNVIREFTYVVAGPFGMKDKVTFRNEEDLQVVDGFADQICSKLEEIGYQVSDMSRELLVEPKDRNGNIIYKSDPLTCYLGFRVEV